jgi:hypothetical protein
MEGAAREPAGQAPRRLGYAVLSHRDPPQVERVVDRLVAGDDDVLVMIRHDPFALAGSRPFSRAAWSGPASERVVGGASLAADRVTVVDATRPTGWGTFAFTESLLEAMRWAVGPAGRDWLIVLSGQDYPARPLSQLGEHLAAAGADAFLEVAAIGDGRVPSGRRDAGAELYRYRYAVGPPAALLPSRCVAWLLRASGRQRFVSVQRNPRTDRLLIGYRSPGSPFSRAFPPVKGRTWFAVNRRAIERILSFVGAHPGYVRHYRRTFFSSESFFHTILLNDPRLRIHQTDLHYEQWGAHDPSPETLGPEDLPEIRRSGAFFVRKVDATSGPLLDLLDRELGVPAR